MLDDLDLGWLDCLDVLWFADFSRNWWKSLLIWLVILAVAGLLIALLVPD